MFKRPPWTAEVQIMQEQLSVHVRKNKRRGCLKPAGQGHMMHFLRPAGSGLLRKNKFSSPSIPLRYEGGSAGDVKIKKGCAITRTALKVLSYWMLVKLQGEPVLNGAHFTQSPPPLKPGKVTSFAEMWPITVINHQDKEQTGS